MSDVKYEFTGDGLGIPGLPHLISKDQARALGLQSELEAAIKAGKYKQVKTKKLTTKATKATK